MNISEIKVGSPSTGQWAHRFNWLYPTLILTAFLAFFRLSDAPIEQWDEARIGIHAVEMIQTGDLINLYSGGEPDLIQVQPPLVIWMVALNFKLFGYNAFSLRLHSAVAAIFIFFFLFRIVQLYRPPLFAFGLCLVMLSVRAIIGSHVSGNGDADAVLMAFLFAGLYYFLRYLDFMRYHDIYKAALLWGFAFLAKGIAFGLLFPGLILYLLADGRLLHVLRLREVYKALAILLAFPIAWYLIVYLFSHQLEDPLISGRNIFERLLLYKVEDRPTQNQFAGQYATADPLFLWRVLRENFRHWDLVFYAVLLSGIGRKLWTGLPRWEPLRYRFTILSCCIWVPLAVCFSIGSISQSGYFVPAIPFVAATALSGIWWLYKQYARSMLIAFSIFWVFCMYDRYFDPQPLPTESATPDDTFTAVVQRQSEHLAAEEKIYQVGERPARRVMLDLYFINPNIIYTAAEAPLNDHSSKISIIIHRAEWDKQRESFVDFSVVDEDEFYLILEKK